MKKRLILALAVALAFGIMAMTITGCKDKPTESSTESSEETQESTEKNAGILYEAKPSAFSGSYVILTFQDALKITPDDSFKGTITWASSDPKVVTVEEGLVQPVDAGTANILFTDGTSSGLCCILVDDTPESIAALGALQIEIDGKTYLSSLGASEWAAVGKNPTWISDADGNWVYSVNGAYYVRTSFLYNIICCYFGERTEIQSPDGRMAQLSGSCDITDTEAAPRATQLGGDTTLYTFSRVMKMPDGTYIGKDLYTLIAVNDLQEKTVNYHTIQLENRIYEDIADYLDRFGVNYELNYDGAKSVLTVSLKSGKE